MTLPSAVSRGLKIAMNKITSPQLSVLIKGIFLFNVRTTRIRPFIHNGSVAPNSGVNL